MKLLAHYDDQVEVGLGLEELVFLRKALGEICEGFDFTEDEFQEIFDVPREEAEAVVRAMAEIMERLGLASPPG